MPASVWAVIVAGGEGRRFGAPKQFVRLGGKPVVDWAIEAARSVAHGVVLVVPATSLSEGARGADVAVAGGASRSASVRAGLAAVPDDTEVVVVHDAARPLASPALFGAVVAAIAAGADGAVPGVTVSDTVKRVSDGRVVETLDRSQLVAVQTPQAFRAEVLRRAHAGHAEATDDAGLLELLGAGVVLVAGERANVKLTSPADLVLLESFVESDAGPSRLPVRG